MPVFLSKILEFCLVLDGELCGPDDADGRRSCQVCDELLPPSRPRGSEGLPACLQAVERVHQAGGVEEPVWQEEVDSQAAAAVDGWESKGGSVLQPGSKL